MCSARRGITLLEALMATVLLLLLLTLLLQIVLPMGRGTMRGTQQIEFQQVATLALNRLAHDLSTTPVAGLSRASSNGATQLAMQRLLNVAADGNPVYAAQLIVVSWRSQDGRLTRKVWPPGPPALGRMPTANDLFTPSPAELDLLSLPATSDPILASQVQEFTVDLLQAVVSLHLKLRWETAQNPETFELNRRVYLPNQ
jgi:hypothetical protein